MRLILSLAALVFAQMATAEPEFFGDLRWRSSTTRKEATPFRYADMLRVRPGVRVPIEEEIKATIRIGLGEAGNTITSTNQSLTNADKKPLWLDLAFVSWEPHQGCLLSVGKMQNLWIGVGDSQQIFDADYTPEGVAYRHSPEKGILATVHAHWLKERYSADPTADQGDSHMLGGQIGYGDKTAGTPWKALIGFLAFTNFKGTASLGGTSFGGNSSVAGAYEHDYELGVVAGEVELSTLGHPFLLYTEALQNLRVSDEQNAVLAGFKWRKAKEKGNWAIGYSFRYTEADAILAALSDGDVGQRSDGRGHTVAVDYVLSQRIKSTLTNYFWEVDLENPSWYHRINLDFIASF